MFIKSHRRMQVSTAAYSRTTHQLSRPESLFRHLLSSARSGLRHSFSAFQFIQNVINIFGLFIAAHRMPHISQAKPQGRPHGVV